MSPGGDRWLQSICDYKATGAKNHPQIFRRNGSSTQRNQRHSGTSKPHNFHSEQDTLEPPKPLQQSGTTRPPTKPDTTLAPSVQAPPPAPERESMFPCPDWYCHKYLLCRTIVPPQSSNCEIWPRPSKQDLDPMLASRLKLTARSDQVEGVNDSADSMYA